MKAVLRKLVGSRGFTLAETLIAVLILMMVSAIVAGAIPAASNAFTKAVDAANAQVLLSTAKTVLRDELSTAADVTIKQNDATALVIQYRSNINGWSQIVYTKAGADAGIVIKYRRSPRPGETDYYWETNRDLISGKATTKNLLLVLSDPKQNLDKTVLTMDINVKRKGTGAALTDLASEDDFAIRSVG